MPLNDQIESLLEEARQSHSEGVQILEQYKGKDLPKEKSAEVDGLFDAAEAKKAHADRLFKADNFTADIEEYKRREAVSRPAHGHPGGEDSKGMGGFMPPRGAELTPMQDAYLRKHRKHPEQEHAFKCYLRRLEAPDGFADGGEAKAWGMGLEPFTPAAAKALSALNDPDGGILATHEFRNEMITKLRDVTEIRQRATVITTSSQQVTFPTFDYDGSAPVTGEGGTTTEEDITNAFGKKAFTPHKRSRIFRVPEELVEDADFAIESFLTNHFAMRFGEIEEEDFINGSGVNVPLGLLQAGLPSVNVASGAAITAENIIDLSLNVRKVYRRNGVYMLHRNSIKIVRKLRAGTLDSNDAADYTVGDLLWQPNFQAGMPPSLNGHGVAESEFFPDNTSGGSTGDPLVLFGDLTHYWIVDHNGFSVQRNDSLYMATGEIGYRMKKRTDGAPVLQDPFYILGHA